MAALGRHAFPFRRSGTAAMLLLAGWLPAQPAQAPPAATANDKADNPSDWLRFKALWRSIESGTSGPEDLEAELAACFDLPAHEAEATLDWTERAVAERSSGLKVLSPARYALALLASTQIRTIGAKPLPLRTETRMAYILPERRAEWRFQGAENPTTRLEALVQRWRTGGLPTETLLAALAGVRMDIYHYRALRMAVEIHRRHHPVKEPPPSGQTDLEVRAQQSSLLGFLRDPSRSQVGTDAWLAQYVKAAQKLQKYVKEPQATLLQQQEAVLAEALQRLEAAKPRLETLFEALERPTP